MSQPSDVPIEAVVAAFDSENGAADALHDLKELTKEKVISIQNAAVLSKDDKGKLHVKETADMSGGKGAAIGGVLGGVVGLIFPPSILASAAVGAAIGGLSAKLSDAGFPDERLKRVGDGLKPNTSALIAVIEHTWVLQVEDRLREYGADVVTEAIRSDIAAQLETETPVPVSSEGAATGGEASAASEVPPPETSAGGTAAPPA